MPLDKNFLDTVEKLRMPLMGTELMGPLLYSLIRSTRPSSVMEAGMGYTSPFIAQALVDNLEDFNKEVVQLENKLHVWNESRNLLKGEEQQEELHNTHLEYLRTDPPLVSPSYYCSEYKPMFHAIDNMEQEESSATKVMDVIQSLNLTHIMKFHNTDFRRFFKKLNNQWLPFDFIWMDSSEMKFTELFDLLNPNGGIMVIHNMLTSIHVEKELSDIKQAQATTMFNEFELFSILEPHKFCQSSAILIKRTSEYKSKLFPEVLTPKIEQEATYFLQTRATRKLEDV